MNYKRISFYLSLFCFPISLLSFVNILYASYFDYFLSIDTYFITLIASLLIGLSFFYYGKKSSKNINFIEQILLVISVYILTSILIALPFYLSNYQVTFLNSVFESISGLTGTGFSIFKDIKYLDPTLIIWRYSSQWIGGLFFLYFLIIVFSNKSFNYKMTNLTYSGDNNFNSENNLKNNLLRIFIIYSLLSIVIISLLNLSGVRLFNSLNLTMTLISGGGFLPTENLYKIISTNFQKIILIFAFMVSLLNFYLVFNLFNKNNLIKDHKEDFYLVILSIIFCALIYFNNYDGLDIILNVTSSLANSGLTLMVSDNNLSLYFLLITIIGGSLISNSSGIKLSRFYILLKITSLEIIKLISPNSIINKTIFGSDKKYQTIM